MQTNNIPIPEPEIYKPASFQQPTSYLGPLSKARPFSPPRSTVNDGQTKLSFRMYQKRTKPAFSAEHFTAFQYLLAFSSLGTAPCADFPTIGQPVSVIQMGFPNATVYVA
jgi:hypothetical protein